MPLLIAHTSHPSETHYYALTRVPVSRRILLHTHANAPYVPAADIGGEGVEFTVYSSGECADVISFTIGVDWRSTFGRWATRYLTTVVSWAIAVVALLFFNGLGVVDRNSALHIWTCSAL